MMCLKLVSMSENEEAYTQTNDNDAILLHYTKVVKNFFGTMFPH